LILQDSLLSQHQNDVQQEQLLELLSRIEQEELQTNNENDLLQNGNLLFDFFLFFKLLSF
jgi:hypothetical protein